MAAYIPRAHPKGTSQGLISEPCWGNVAWQSHQSIEGSQPPSALRRRRSQCVNSPKTLGKSRFPEQVVVGRRFWGSPTPPFIPFPLFSFGFQGFGCNCSTVVCCHHKPEGLIAPNVSQTSCFPWILHSEQNIPIFLCSGFKMFFPSILPKDLV